jgi:arylsulfatase A-like enzyme
MISVMDIFPTLAAAAGIDHGASKPLDGLDMWPAISTGKQVERKQPLFFAQESPIFGSFKHTLLEEQWKLIQLVEQDLEKTTVRNLLFDIGRDPYEFNDVAAANPEIVQRMAAEIRHWRSQYMVSGTRANLVPPPGWRAPLDWVNYPVPVAELQDRPAPGMVSGSSLRLMQRSLGDRGRLGYD